MKKLFLFITIILVLIYLDNILISSNEITIEIQNLPDSFEGVKVVQISDLHDSTFGNNQKRLVKKIKRANPDYIFITGDIIDSSRYDLQNSIDLVEKIKEIAPIFYVTGNHEIATEDTKRIKEALFNLDVQVLSNQMVWLEKEQEKIRIIGIEDPLNGVEVADALAEFPTVEYPTIVLSHRPEFFDVYVNNQLDVVFSGHAHGGQFRVPGLGGVFAPGQGLFPKYTAGAYKEERTTMVVSRGLGNSIIPIRIFNMPEIVLATLTKK